MVDNKDIKLRINEYLKLLKELRAEKIELPKQFVVGLLIEKLPDSWSNYKQQLKHKHKQLSLVDMITHIIIEIQIAKCKRQPKQNKLPSRQTWSKLTLKLTIIKLKTLITNLKLLTPILSRRKALVMFVANQAITHPSAERE